MTEKRFTFDIDNENGYDEEPYFCNGIDSFYVNNADEMELFIKEINELADENQYLKSLKWNQDCINEISISMQQIQLLKKENEQLEKEIVLLQNRLHNCNMKSRKIAITEMKDAIKKMERYE